MDYRLQDNYKKHIGILVFFILILSFTKAQAQFSEVGLGVGTMTYNGDLQQKFSYSNPSIGITGYYKNNFSDVLSLRLGLTLGQLKDNDRTPFDELAKNREASFSSFLYEAAATLEYNFLDYKSGKGVVNFSPYVFFGLAAVGQNGTSTYYFTTTSGSPQKVEKKYNNGIMLAIPFGLGVKYSLSPALDLNFEFGARKVFSDKLDNISRDGDVNTKDYVHGSKETDDWYYFTGISVSYSFYRIVCPHNFY